MRELFWKIFNNVRAVALAIIVHLIVLGVLVVNMGWLDSEPVPVSAPVPVKARVVEKERVEKELARVAEDRKRREEEKKRQQREIEQKRQQKEQAHRRMVEEKRRKEQQKKQAEQRRLEKKIAAQKRRKQEEARKQKLAEEAEQKRIAEERQRLALEAEKRKMAEERQRLALLEAQRRQKAAEAAEKDMLQAMEDEENDSKVQEFKALIRDDIQNNWKIPPTARKGMECLLTVRLLPNGIVQNVRITRSSGDAVFDRSVEDAVHKASPLPVSSSSAGSRLFQTTFREFNFRFKPTNL